MRDRPLDLEIRPTPKLADFDVGRVVGIHVPTQWGRTSKERRDAHPLGTVGGWAYYALAAWEPSKRRYVRVRPEPRVELQRPAFVAFADLPPTVKRSARLARKAR